MLTHRTQVAISELKLIRTIERIEKLKHEGRWAFRQTKKQRGVGGLMKNSLGLPPRRDGGFYVKSSSL
ncbi:hypothetical protein FA13DRAFT_1749814, partial [Coprinellus micaceus]